MEEPSTTSFPGYQCSGDPPCPPAIDGLERFGGSLAGPAPTHPVPSKHHLSSVQGRVYGQYLQLLGFRLLLK